MTEIEFFFVTYYTLRQTKYPYQSDIWWGVHFRDIIDNRQTNTMPPYLRNYKFIDARVLKHHCHY